MFHIVSILSMLLSYKYSSCIMISLHEGVSVPPCSRTQSIFLIMLYLVFLLPFRTLGLPPPVCVCVCSQLLRHVWLLVAPWTVAQQTPLLMEFSRQEYWSVMPFLTPGNLPNPDISLGFSMSLGFPALGVNSLPLAPPVRPTMCQPL